MYRFSDRNRDEFVDLRRTTYCGLIRTQQASPPLRHIIADMPFSEKFLVVLFAQFGASYLLAYLGAQLRIRIAKPPE
jgi:hypothetical protein